MTSSSSSSLLNFIFVVVAFLAAFVVASAGAAASKSPVCTASMSNVYVLAVPTQTLCTIVYDSAWKVLVTAAAQGSTGSVSMSQSFVRMPSNIEFYSSADCSSDSYINNVGCSAAATTTTTTTTAPPPTTKPTTTIKPTSPTTKPTTTTKPTSTTKPTTTTTVNPTSPTKPTTTTKPTSTTSSSTSSSSSSSRAPSGVRAMYVWEYSACFFNAVSGDFATACLGASDYLSFQDMIFTNVLNPFNTFKPYNRLFVEMDIDTINNNPAVVRAFLVKAHGLGIAIEFLGGDATWVTTAALAAIPMGICDNLVSFNQGSTNSAEWMDGVHFDIEPHTLGATWHENTAGGTDSYNQAYQSTLITIFTHCKQVTRPTSMTVTWDVGDDYYYYVTDLWNPLVTNPYVDYVTIMNYFSNATYFLYGGPEDGLNNIGGISNILASLQGAVPAVFAAESMPAAYAPAWQSFATQGATAMEDTEAEAVQVFANTLGFAGTATHWYGSYFAMSLT